MRNTGSPAPIRVAVLGAESSGKSSLAEALAAYYHSLWVPEYLREFVDTLGRVPQAHEQILIARTQVAREDQAAEQANRYLFCDTTPLMTAIYSRHYFVEPDAELRALVEQRRYGFTIVTAPDMPWTPDGLQRESEAIRQKVHEELLEELRQRSIPYLLVSGELQDRIAQVRQVLGEPQTA
jgi:NadR type nicotinamide-nucleotide adenylyltransferase